MTLNKKIATCIAAGTLLVVALLPGAAFASSKPPKNVNINTVKVTQINKSFILTGVLSVAVTGGNTIKGSTKHDEGSSDPSITTGNATSTVNVTVGGSSNSANVNPCPCGTGNVTTLSDESGGSNNSVTTVNINSTEVTQINKSADVTLVGSVAGTGGNTISGNTGGDSLITTGNATSSVTVSVTGSTNTL